MSASLTFADGAVIVRHVARHLLLGDREFLVRVTPMGKTVVSGAAFGIDQAALRGALLAGGTE
jgi:predicted Rossmann fold nucleotide-binding protein DprA/Smf involved in DNA uptake